MKYKDIVTKVSIPVESKVKQKNYMPKGAIPIIDQGKELIGGYSDLKELVLNCELPVVVFGDHTKVVKLIRFPFISGADGIKVLKPKSIISSKFLYYGTQYLTYIIEDKGYARHYQFLEKSDLHIPSLPDQEKIVLKIEELFSELDKGIAELNEAKARLKIYRQAVLKSAFEGITEYIELGEITNSRLGKMLDKNKNKGVFKPYLRNINVRWLSFDLTDLIEMKFEDTEIEKFSICKNDLVICEGGEPGRCAIWKSDENIFYQKALHRVRFKDNYCPSFYMYYLWYIAQTGKLSDYFTGTGIKHLTGESLRKVLVPNETKHQNHIVQQIESKLSVCDNVEKTIEEQLIKAENLRQSILKKAFEGRLV